MLTFGSGLTLIGRNDERCCEECITPNNKLGGPGSPMSVAFYDNREPLTATETTNSDRVYCLDRRRFGEPKWTTRERNYREPHGWGGYHHVPFC